VPTYPPVDQLVLLNEELQQRAELAADEMEGLDRKATPMVAGTAVVLGLGVNNVDLFRGLPCEPRYLFFGALVALMGALVAGVVTLWPRKAKVIPSPRGLVEGYYAKDHDETLANLVSARLHAAELNKNLARGKIWALKAQMFLLAVGAASLVLAFLLKEAT
jgi:hypothetical protein